MRDRLRDLLPRLVLAPSFALILFFVYGFNLWTLLLSFTNSKAFTNFNFIGWSNYQKLWTWTFQSDPPSNWYTAIVNMGLFGGLYVIFCLALGLLLAIFLDQKIRGEGILRPLYLYPLALSFIVTGTAWVTGADKVDHHVVDLVCGRDFTPDGVIDVAEVREGDASPDGHGTLVAARGIEIGHIFQLGRKFADVFGLDALGPDGKPVRITMGSYGIGVSRLVAVIAEQSHDALGLVWPREVAPADVHVVVAGKDESIHEGGAQLASSLSEAGLSVLLDDRTATPGVKFADAELIGVPTIVVVGRGLKNGVVEVKDRVSGERVEVAVDEAVAHLTALVR